MLHPYSHDASDKSKQNKITIIVAILIFIATISATLFVGWITSLQSAKENQTLPPQINFDTQNDIIKASSYDNITSWHYVGPNNNSLCDGSLFAEVFNLGKQFKDGNQFRIDYHRDLDKYYCFRAIDDKNQSGFAVKHITDIEPPVILFKNTQSSLEAYLNQDANNTQSYNNNWQYIILPNLYTSCSASIFNILSDEIINSKIADTTTLTEDRYFCFRISSLSGKYVYQAQFFQINGSIKPNIETYKIGNHLYLKADQNIRNWQTTIVSKTDDCNEISFKNNPTIKTSQSQLAAILLDDDFTNHDYCIRVQNDKGVYNYTNFKTDTYKNQPLISVHPYLNNNTQTINLIADSDQPLSNWQLINVKSYSDCLNNFNDYDLISITNNLTLAYPPDASNIYCFRAQNLNEYVRGAYFIPEFKARIITYKENNILIATDIAVEKLTNWQFITASNQPNDSYCNAADFNNLKVYNNNRVLFTDDNYYCFRAFKNNVAYYSLWVQPLNNNIKIKADSKKISLNYDYNLKLTPLGQAIFYQTETRYYQNRNDLNKACKKEVVTSCYDRVNKTLHVYDDLKLSDNLNELKLNILEIAKLEYLNSGQKNILDFKLRLFYQSNQELINSLDTENSLKESFYLDDLNHNLYVIINKALIDDNLEFIIQADDWFTYYSLFFN